MKAIEMTEGHSYIIQTKAAKAAKPYLVKLITPEGKVLLVDAVDHETDQPCLFVLDADEEVTSTTTVWDRTWDGSRRTTWAVAVHGKLTEASVYRTKNGRWNYDLTYEGGLVLTHSCFGSHMDAIMGAQARLVEAITTFPVHTAPDKDRDRPGCSGRYYTG